MGIDGKTGLVVNGEVLDEDYNQCILPPNNGRHPGHMRHTYRNPRADFDASYEGDVVQIKDLVDGSYIAGVGRMRRYKTHGTHQCITILKLHTWFNDRSPATVGSASVLCDIVNCLLATNNVISLSAAARSSIENMVGPSRRRVYSYWSIGSGTTRSYFEIGKKYYCYCRLEAAVLKTDDNYRRRFMACPRR
ncbi:hypothetical protein Cgig2_032289 [Carnegiea gigantea]|uniref:Uncharacterized protein n=1 Tax=Carnegiea gigantea TaxID=171969 RepID=A0A9Q1JHM5_9CARY|nr:hypothetical protein Cgig2_032289 [Carnegiea gigantea]